MTLSELFTNIANAIRGKDGSVGSIPATEFASRINAIDTQENLDEELSTQDSLISDIVTALEGKTAVAPAEPIIESLNVTKNGTYTASNGVDGYSPVTVSIPPAEPVIESLNVTIESLMATENGTYTAPTGVDGYSPVTVAIPGVELPKPVIEFDEGVITATVNQEAGLVGGGTRSASKSITVFGPTDITPGTTDQIAVPKDMYTIRDAVVKGDVNLVSSNIKSGVSIFGVKGAYSGGSSNALFMGTATGTGSYHISFTTSDTSALTSVYNNGVCTIVIFEDLDSINLNQCEIYHMTLNYTTTRVVAMVTYQDMSTGQINWSINASCSVSFTLNSGKITINTGSTDKLFNVGSIYKCIVYRN